ncbi:MAG: PPOX class F420-dependent oxidoreductase, partial [Solirubrobacteraceae bacterium]|nr:PPOX class F420-dependent oxidoreductase [Solirubrobacteraceae bacterium]
IRAVVPELATSRYMLLTTVKRDGTGVATPVWFAASGDQLVATSDANAWKVKRLRNHPLATVAPCDVRGRPEGPAVPVVGELLSDAERPAAAAALQRRYGAALDGFNVLVRVARRGRRPERAFMGFRPA